MSSANQIEEINNEREKKKYSYRITPAKINIIQTSIYLTIILATICNYQSILASFIDSSTLKPSVFLILPQSLRGPAIQYVAIINNIQNERDDSILRQQYKKLVLQVRDANPPITGQLFYEHIFDYFEQDRPHLLIPINLDQVSESREIVTDGTGLDHSTATGSNIANRKPQHVIISVRPYQLDSGFGSEGIEFVSSVPVPVEFVANNDGKRSFAIVQTDKPIYKPDEKVRIRSLVVNENFRPVLKDELRLQIKNPHKVIVEEVRFPNPRTNNTSLSGQIFSSHVFEFPPEPMLGTWSVHLLHRDPVANDITSFEVREYVLPTYEIQFKLPNYVLPDTTIIPVSIFAKYHFGKPVIGKAQFKFGYRESASSKPKLIARSTMKTVDPLTGRVDYNIRTEKFKNESRWFPSIAGSNLFVEVTVTEISTGHREIAQDTSCTFITMPYKISFEESIEYFKPGLRQQLSVQILEMQTGLPGPGGLRVMAQYVDQNSTFLGSARAVDNRPVDFRQSMDSEAVTDESGRAIFNLGPLSEDISSIDVSFRVVNSTGQDIISIGRHLLLKHESHNGWISLINKTTTDMHIGDQFISDLLIRDAIVTPKKIFYTLTTKGQIIGLNSLDRDGLLRFEIGEDMLPAVRIVLFALTQDSVGLISDSMTININQNLKCDLNLEYASDPAQSTNVNFVRPGDRGRLLINARQGDVVSLIGVDSAVYTLNNRSMVELSRIIQRVKKLDPGCGFGDGKDSLDVFHNAGLMISKEVTEQDITAKAGTACMTVVNQIRHIEDIQLGYNRPLLAASHLSRYRTEIIGRQRSHPHGNRKKREANIENILRKYKDPIHRSCCRLGTLEDLPQRRNCATRGKIVERYMQHRFKSCSAVYFDCCVKVFEEVLLSVIVSGRDSEPLVESRRQPLTEMIQYSGDTINVGHLDSLESLTLIRKDFRETWLFELVEVDQLDGKTSLEVQLPHSITSWKVSAFAVNRYRPMCFMTQSLRIITLKEIFLQVSMPYKVIQGEQIDLVATVFNYSPKTQEVFVYMYGVDDICSEADPGERSDRKRIKIEQYSSQSILFPIIPLKVGRYPIKILAITSATETSDIIERQLNVSPRGKPVTDETTFSLDPMNQQRRSKRAIQTGNLVDEIDSSKGLQRSKVRLTPSRDSEHIVPQTQECIVSAIGDKMGHSVQTTMLDVENLIRLPHGCGEQVMIYLGPTLYTARYLSSINKLSGDLRWRAIRYIQSGYQRVLNYRKADGSFSAFAKRDPSIWLTAFIAKMLCQTEKTPFIADEVHVDKTVINSALNWLVDKQNKDTGTWVELNPVYHREMLGGILKENALTAFVTVTFNECTHHSTDLVEETVVEEGESAKRGTPTQTNGVDKLKISTERAEQSLLLDHHRAMLARNPYVLALTAYALSFSQPKEAISSLNDLMMLAERSQSRNHIYWRGDYQVETAAYGLLAIIEVATIVDTHTSKWQPNIDSIAISNWLASRRSYTGAFESTQDTIVALEALSRFSQLQSSPSGHPLSSQGSKASPSLTCNVTINNRMKRSIEFDRHNSQILQTIKLESLDIDAVNGEILDIVTSGNGIGTMSVKLKYNVLQEEDELCRFDIESSIEEWQPKIVKQQPEINSSDDDIKESNEPIIEDDYFKIFDKSMLGELNLVDANQLDSLPNPKQQKQHLQPKLEVVRFKRYSHLSSSTESDASSGSESWTSRMVSSIKSKLPFWPNTNPVSQQPRSAMNPKHDDSLREVHNNMSPRKTNTSRRSTHIASIPLISTPTGIPNGVKLNTLSEQLEVNLNNTTNNMSSSNHETLRPNSNRLVLLLRVCTHHLSSRRDSEMAVIEIGILSGFRPNESDLKEIISEPGTTAMKYEISNDRSMVILYMEYIPFSGPYCIQFRLIRDSLVYNLQSGYIRVYEYYSPTHSCSNFYTPARITDLIETKCDSSGQVCKCATRSLCPATNKLIDLGDIYSVNSTRARNQLMDLVCSDRFDFVSLVRLKSVKHLETGKMFKLSLKVKSDLKGNLTKIIDAQKTQKLPSTISIRKPISAPVITTLESSDSSSIVEEEEDTSFDLVSASVDSNCIRNDPLLLHLAHPNQWKQGGELMILFGKYHKIEKRFFRSTTKASISSPLQGTEVPIAPKPKPNILSSLSMKQTIESDTALMAKFEDAQQLQYSLTIQLDKDSILYDITYQAKAKPRETINNLILWLELKTRREKWNCPIKQTL